MLEKESYQRLNCFCCNRVIEHFNFDENDPTSVSEVSCGLCFTAHGNYGSRVYDPVPARDGGKGTEYLKIFICDECVQKKKSRVTRIFDIRHEVVAKGQPFDG